MESAKTTAADAAAVAASSKTGDVCDGVATGRRSKRAKTTVGSYSSSRGTPVKMSREDFAKDMGAIKKMRGRKALSTEECLCIVHLYLKLKQRRQQPSRGAPKKTTVQQEVADLLGYSRSTVGSIFSRWNELKRQNGGKPPASFAMENERGKHAKGKRIPESSSVIALVHDFVEGKRAKHQSVTAVQLTEYLEEQGILEIKRDPLTSTYDKAAWNAAHRVTCSYMKKHGFLRAKEGKSRSNEEGDGDDGNDGNDGSDADNGDNGADADDNDARKTHAQAV
ncbi:hypothetical protein PTSG_12034 [Salpingoeca rosetta]|uniref:Uncharacterized protein n=1 Tax=Salpingoeca rosetta (strain ATCC 50818 / BSB-021) TaxID=946362 RepID=F2U5T2_SALR5|nr:uncharacterized protein PTSG_12034 [Salpingoeca rosetta]EGD82873.1 hypothetical protein PTSG_12034 [Salpingoeca rosetta]|eukprot:XP_004995237.1 hypothetical protein PTSG_12034 [Salpingoeca rosetta]